METEKGEEEESEEVTAVASTSANRKPFLTLQVAPSPFRDAPPLMRCSVRLAKLKFKLAAHKHLLPRCKVAAHPCTRLGEEFVVMKVGEGASFLSYP